MEVLIQIDGITELLNKLDGRKLLGKALKNFFNKATLKIERQAKINATGRPGPNVQTDRLRSSITSRIDAYEIPTWGLVGTNVYYAPFVEFGHSQKPGRYVPAIGKRLVADRVPAYPYLMPAYDQSKDAINDLISEAEHEIESEFTS